MEPVQFVLPKAREEVDLTALTATLPADFKRESQLVQWVTTAPASGSYVLAHS